MVRKATAEKENEEIVRSSNTNEVFHTPGPAPTHSAIPEFVANAEQAVEIEADFNKMRLTMEEVSSQVTRLERAQENIGLMIRQELTKILPTIIAQSLSPTQTQVPSQAASQASVQRSTRNQVDRRDALAIRALNEDEIQEKIIAISELLEENEIEIEVTWYLTLNGPETSITWRGSPRASCDEQGNPILVVTYEKGDYPLPKDGVSYIKIETVTKIPVMPGKIEDPELVGTEDSTKFVFHNVRTWNVYLRSGDPLSIDMLEHRIRIDLELPTVMTEEVAFLWGLLKQWMHEAARRGGIEEELHEVSIGQQLLDKLRITQGVYRGADSSYVRTHYENQRSDDTLGNTIRRSISYGTRGRMRSRDGYRGGFYRGVSRGTYPSVPVGRGVSRGGFQARGSGLRS